MASVIVSDITKSFGETAVLRRVSLNIEDGEFLTLVGPSGCGKSTLLRIIAGLETQDHGSVQIGDANVDTVHPKNRNVAMVFQSYALYPHLSVFDNIAVPLRMRQLRRQDRWPVIGRVMPGRRDREKVIREQVIGAATSLQIDQLLDRKPGQLSGGQRQRVAVGRAMVREPAAFLMDEPLSNLDAKLRVHMRAEIAQLHRSVDTTFIYVTHDQAEAMTMSDRIAVMMDGEILQLDTPDTIYRNPLDLRVAEFIGSPKINVLPGTYSSRTTIDLSGATIPAPVTGLSGDRVSLALRPEATRLSQVTSGVPATVSHFENLGSDWLVHLDVDGSESRLIARTEPDERTALEIGASLAIVGDWSRALVFDESGKRYAAAGVDTPAREAIDA